MLLTIYFCLNLLINANFVSTFREKVLCLVRQCKEVFEWLGETLKNDESQNWEKKIFHLVKELETLKLLGKISKSIILHLIYKFFLFLIYSN